ncbi:MAG: EutN/CcmL family microcompartment protein [Candidatus Xenobia bacterium]
MVVARVIGTVVCTQKDARLNGTRFQICMPVSMTDLKPDGKPVVAVDTVGAGVGELVLIVAGSSARQTSTTQSTPTDAAIMGIIDELEVDGSVTFRKG